jgi:hypothetical protein
MTSPIWLSYSRRMKARGRQFWKPFRTSTLPDASLRQSTRSAIRMSAHVPDRSKAPFIRKSERCQTSMSASRRLRPCIGRCRGAQTTSNSQEGGVRRSACVPGTPSDDAVACAMAAPGSVAMAMADTTLGSSARRRAIPDFTSVRLASAPWEGCRNWSWPEDLGTAPAPRRQRRRSLAGRLTRDPRLEIPDKAPRLRLHTAYG